MPWPYSKTTGYEICFADRQYFYMIVTHDFPQDPC